MNDDQHPGPHSAGYTEEAQAASEPTARELDLIKQRDEALAYIASMPPRALLLKFIMELSSKALASSTAIRSPEYLQAKFWMSDVVMEAGRMVCYIQTGGDTRKEWPELKPMHISVLSRYV
jgi:hypothetical protein